MKKGMTIFALTTILCGAAAITENHNQAFARSGSHSSGHSASSGRSSHSSGHSASSGRSSHSSGHSASSGRSSHSSGHSASSGRSSHSSAHSANSGKNSHSKGHSATVGRSTSSKGHSATTGRNTSSKSNNATVGRSTNSKGHSATTGRSTSSKGNNATVGRSTNSKGHSVTTGKGSNFKGHTAVVGRNSNLKTTNAATKGKNVNTKNVANSKNIAYSHLDALVAGHNKAFTKKSTKPTNSKNIAISHLDAIVAEHDKAFISKTLNSKTVATKKYKTKEEISKLSTVQLLKDIIKNRDGKGITQLHGNYCGPGHGDIKNGPPPVDLLDLGCKIHDEGYDKKGYFNRDVNNRFIEFVNKNASKMKPAERELAYYYAEGFERMNKTPLQEVAKVASIISAPVRMAYNLISDGVKGTVNLISKGVKAIGSLFNSNRIISFGTVPHRNIERAEDRGSGNNPFLLQNQPRRAR